jgi:hypothetical protein
VFRAAVVCALALVTAACGGTGATPDRPFGPRTKESGCVVHDALPDTACTPGAVFPDVTGEQICQRGYSSSVRNVPAALSRQVYVEYGILERSSGEYEVDHLVPLEAGGSNDIANLFPEAAEPRPGFHEKDQVENYLHDQVCSGALSLFEAQREIATNWVEVYQRLRPGALATVVTTQPVPGASVEITSVTGARPGGSATVTAHTTPGAGCSVVYRTPAGTVSTAQGLAARTADASGTVSWTWDIGPATGSGTGRVEVTCGAGTARSPIEIG